LPLRADQQAVDDFSTDEWRGSLGPEGSMGTWGFEIFDDDVACDFFDEIKADPRRFFTRAFRQALDSDYIGELNDLIAPAVRALEKASCPDTSSR
jgi:hypothetical protein